MIVVVRRKMVHRSCRAHGLVASRNHDTQRGCVFKIFMSSRHGFMCFGFRIEVACVVCHCTCNPVVQRCVQLVAACRTGNESRGESYSGVILGYWKSKWKLQGL